MKWLIYSINVFCVIIILWRFVVTNSDKSIILIMVYYPFLLLLNLIIAGVFKIFKNTIYKYFIDSCILLLAILVPILIWATH